MPAYCVSAISVSRGPLCQPLVGEIRKYTTWASWVVPVQAKLCNICWNDEGQTWGSLLAIRCLLKLWFSLPVGKVQWNFGLHLTHRSHEKCNSHLSTHCGQEPINTHVLTGKTWNMQTAHERKMWTDKIRMNWSTKLIYILLKPVNVLFVHELSNLSWHTEPVNIHCTIYILLCSKNIWSIRIRIGKEKDEIKNYDDVAWTHTPSSTLEFT